MHTTPATMFRFFLLMLSLCCSAHAKMFQFSTYSPSYDHEYEYGFNHSDYEQEYNYTSRIRYFKAIDVNVNITIDIQISIPLQNSGSFDLEIPITILIQNKTIIKIPYPYPPLKVPLFYPVIKLPKFPKLPSFLFSGGHSNQEHQQYPDYYENQDQAMYDYFSQPQHQLAKRSLAAHSALHRHEIFRCIENAIDKYGQDGRSCMLKAICQLAQKELIIESVLHEIIEHLLSVSRSVDEEGLLKEYVAAERYGQKGGDCEQKYVCPFSVFQKL